MQGGSIQFRIFIYSAIWLVAALAVTAFLLSGLYARALDNALVETLEFHQDTLVGAVLSGDIAGAAPGTLADPRFSRPASGWYWEIRRADGPIVSFSPSLIGTVLPRIDGSFDMEGRRSGVVEDGYGATLQLVERTISAEGERYLIVATGNLDDNADLTSRFRGQTFIVLGAVGAMLAIMSALVARFALRPIARLRREIEQVREGSSESIEGVFPREIAPLADEVNQLLASNKQIIERARNQVGNLAHGLKTPLAVLRNESSRARSALGKTVTAEVEKMAGIVATYLDRAKLAARTAVIGRRTDSSAVLSRLVRVMQKLHSQCSIELTETEPPVPWFRGEEGDLEEIAGNLLDNACKWASGKVYVTAGRGDDPARPLRIVIEDDGPGLADSEIQSASARGVRLDEKVAGSGLGLDIVRELVDVYGGAIEFGRAETGGLFVQVNLPAAGEPRH